MRVLNIGIIQDFSTAFPDTKSALKAWLAEVQDADWKTPVDLKQRYPSASIFSGKKVVFNIKGNKYRILALIDYESGIVLVKEIGTHADYDRWSI